MANRQFAGFLCTAERARGLRNNFSFADVSEADIATMMRAVVQDGRDAAAIVCTNLRGASLAPALEQETGVPVLDWVAVTLWRSLIAAGYPVDQLKTFGRLFA